MRPERALIPLAAIALAVFATTRVMVSIDPGEARPAASGAKVPERGDRTGSARERERGRHGRRSRETYSFYSVAGMRQLKSLLEAEAGRGGRAAFLRVQANQVQVQVGKAGQTGGEILIVDRGPNVRFRTPTPVIGGIGFPPRALDVRAPERIVRTIAGRAHGSAAAVDYMVFTVNPIEREGGWDAFLSRTLTHFHADAHGRHLTRP